MLDTVLERLGGLLPRNFLIAAFFPVLLFAGANGVMFYLTNANFRRWVANYLELDVGKQAYYAFPLLIIIASAAYIFSMLNLSLRRILEGEPPFVPQRWKSKLKEQLSSGQRAKLERLEALLNKNKLHWWKMKRHEGEWHASLDAAWEEGKLNNETCAYTNDTEAAKDLAALMDKRARNAVIEFEEMTKAISSLTRELAKCDIGSLKTDDKDYDNKRRLDDADTIVRELINYAVNRVEEDYAEYYNRREYNYSRYRIAPTTMGNVAESVRSYALSRYGMNLDPLWLRVQKLVQEDKDFYASLQDAKTQLDFLVSLCWLTIIFTASWLIYLVSVRQSVRLFVVLGILGPALAFMWYQIAIQNYLAFADVLRTALDLYRFKMLDALHLKRPGNSEEERQLWNRLNRAIGYGDREKIVYKTHDLPNTAAQPPVYPTEPFA